MVFGLVSPGIVVQEVLGGRKRKQKKFKIKKNFSFLLKFDFFLASSSLLYILDVLDYTHISLVFRNCPFRE